MPKKKLSVLRAQRRNERRRLRNLRWKLLYKKLRRAFRKSTDPDEKRKLAVQLQSVIDKMAQRRIFHPNKAARLKSKLFKSLRDV